jgi:hypothetical protein
MIEKECAFYFEKPPGITTWGIIFSVQVAISGAVFLIGACCLGCLWTRMRDEEAYDNCQEVKATLST